MIFNKSKNADAQVPDDDRNYDGDAGDLPPSYQAAVDGSSGSSSLRTASDSKTDSNARTVPLESSSQLRLRPHAQVKSKTRASAFFTRLFGPVGTARQVKETTQALVRDLVQQRTPGNDTGAGRLAPGAAHSVLDSCAEACAAQDLSLAEILREPFIEGHTPIYWAVLVHDGASEGQADTLAELLLAHALAAPTPAPGLADDVRAACTLASDDALWRRLRERFPPLEPSLVGSDRLILASARGLASDEATVEARPRADTADGAFYVRARMPLFQKRMRVVGAVGVEFIAGGRLFRLEFFVNGGAHRRDYYYPEGTWFAAVTILAPSAPTRLFGRLCVQPASTPSSGSTHEKRVRGGPAPLTLHFAAREELRPDAHRDAREVRRPLPDGALQHEGSPYVEAGILTCCFEGRFTPPAMDKPDCVIC
ncbi:hypothetical protein K488DRAFT_87359 [Vararia minispora EC-137]|uniref:Uncharacterized protein n=1 Tax=Vararia minispora EC-137 TaxID=1314806 RepID=A0ACB8QGD6_9AGAM|nr:hypothetical protein K488DRAFT_87359 [Vararia minispora EC-137]